jgi:zinc finger BED domain-containing protein 5/7/8/9
MKNQVTPMNDKKNDPEKKEKNKKINIKVANMISKNITNSINEYHLEIASETQMHNTGSSQNNYVLYMPTVSSDQPPLICESDPSKTSVQSSRIRHSPDSGIDSGKNKKSTSLYHTNTKNRKYDDSYLQWGFTVMEKNGFHLPVCMICNKILSKHSMKPSMLQRHFTTKHREYNNTLINLFKEKRDEFQKRQHMFQKATTISERSLQASYALSLLAVKNNKPHTIVEELVMPSIIEVASIMCGEKMSSIFHSIPCSNDTVNRRIGEMADDVIQQVVDKIIIAKKFTVQLDTSTYVSGEVQLIVIVRFADENDIVEHILLCKTMAERTTGKEIFSIIDNFFQKHGISWEWCLSVCSDGAAAMIGKVSGVIARAKEKNPSISWKNCILHREALASRNMMPVLYETLEDAIKIINFIKSRPLNARMFRKLCEGLQSEHTTLLLHSESRWLSRGNVLLRMFELRNECYLFLKDSKPLLASKFEDKLWVSRLAYLADIFQKLNELNTSLQSHGHHIFSMEDKISAFTERLLFGKVE